jgi:hypothetical protein
MLNQLHKFSPDWEKHANKAVAFETRLFEMWVEQLGAEVKIQLRFKNS